jgi:general stress protein YciG
MRDAGDILGEQSTAAQEPTRKKRGFATMDPEQLRELARRGGVAAHRAGTAHEFSVEEARSAGRKGGRPAHSGPRPVTIESDVETRR